MVPGSRTAGAAVVEGGVDGGAVLVAGLAHHVAGEHSDHQHRDRRRDEHPPLARETALRADQKLLEIDMGRDRAHPPFDAVREVPPELVVVHRSTTRRSWARPRCTNDATVPSRHRRTCAISDCGNLS